MTHPDVDSHYDTIDCRDCGAIIDVDHAIDGMCPDCDAYNYRVNQQ